MRQITAGELLKLPLFMGMTETEAEKLPARFGLSCRWAAAGKTVVEEGDPVNPLLLIYNGRAKRETWAQGRKYRLTEVVEAPAVIQAERLFGLSPRYSSTFRSYGGCALLEIPKAAVYLLLDRHEVFRLNFINLLSSEMQRVCRQAMRPHGRDIETRICRFVERISHFQTGMKDLGITMSQLADELSTTRLNVSVALHNLEARNLVRVKRGHLVVPSMQLLLKSGL